MFATLVVAMLQLGYWFDCFDIAACYTRRILYRWERCLYLPQLHHVWHAVETDIIYQQIVLRFPHGRFGMGNHSQHFPRLGFPYQLDLIDRHFLLQKIVGHIAPVVIDADFAAFETPDQFDFMLNSLTGASCLPLLDGIQVCQTKGPNDWWIDSELQEGESMRSSSQRANKA